MNCVGGGGRRWRATAALALAASLGACACEPAPRPAASPPERAEPRAPDPAAEIEVTGLVAAGAPGGARRGLAGAEVLFLSEAAMRPFLAARAEAAAAGLSAVGRDLEPARAARALRLAEADRADQAWKVTNENDLRRRLEAQFRLRRDPAAVQAVHRDLLAEKKAAWARAVDATRRSDEAERALQTLQARASAYRDGAFYLEGLPPPVRTARTGADGSFALRLPPGRYALAASAELRQAPASELGVWLLWVEAAPGIGLRLDLDDSNRHGSGCRDCAVGARPL